jgi:hypothetical protein
MRSNRTLAPVVGALSVVALALVAPHASAATPAGCALAGNGTGVASIPGSPVGAEMCTFTATGPVSYAGLGFWAIAVQHIDGSPTSSASGASLPDSGTVAAAAGDTVTAQVLAPGGTLLVGNASAG